MATDNAIDKTFGAKNPMDTTQLGSARAIIYQIRCAFAHDPMNPRWDVTPKYNRTYTAAINTPVARTITFDRPSISGKLFSSSDFGGIAGYLGLLEFVLGEVKNHPKGNIPY